MTFLLDCGKRGATRVHELQLTSLKLDMYKYSIKNTRLLLNNNFLLLFLIQPQSFLRIIWKFWGFPRIKQRLWGLSRGRRRNSFCSAIENKCSCQTYSHSTRAEIEKTNYPRSGMDSPSQIYGFSCALRMKRCYSSGRAKSTYNFLRTRGKKHLLLYARRLPCAGSPRERERAREQM